MLRDVELSDRYDLTKSSVLLSGTQALVRATLMQRARDSAEGLNTAAYVSGYRGSPLGTVDAAFQSASKLLEPAISRFHSRDRRKKIRGKLRKAAKSGRLQELLNVIDDTKEVAEDKGGFDQASMEYTRATQSLIMLMRDIHNKPKLAEEYGGQLSVATALLGCVAFVTLAGFWTFL